ncbi:MAG: O-antigen ligase family protein [Saprospiraceae bacterium]
MLIRLFLRYPLLAILLHIGLGYLMKSQPMAVSIFYAALTFVALVEVAATRDREYLAAYYGLYIAGMEILSRMSKSAIFWEFGKYACIAVFGLGSLFGTDRQHRPYLLLAYFALLLPGVIVSAAYGGIGEERIRDLASQYLSGPAALLAAGWYFYQRRFEQGRLQYLLRAGVLPSVAVVTLLFLGKSLSEIDFIGGSNFDASGGFGPNQVSSALGWSIVLVVFGLLFKTSATGYRLLDFGLLALLVFRGLLTFSRGGMMGAFGAIGLSMFVLFFLSASFRVQMKRVFPSMAGGFLLLAGVAVAANNLTGNFLLYRYQGKSTSEVILGRSITQSEYLSGREDIMNGELVAFVEHPLLGIGIGRGTILREATYRNQSIASHTEFTRMLGEHGILGLAALLCAFVFFPFQHFRRLQDDYSRQWMLTFFILSIFSLAHSGLRMALPSVAFGLAFLFILPAKKP